MNSHLQPILQTLNWIKATAQFFSITPELIRYGIVAFDTAAQATLSFNADASYDELAARIDAFPSNFSSRVTSWDIIAAENYLNSTYLSSGGWRNGLTIVVFIASSV